jgi:prevent-host-death family protein
VPDVTATEASRNFADLLDGVEHRGEKYRIVRRGHVIAELAPVVATTGAEAKALLRRHHIDPSWAQETAALRQRLVAEDRF